MSSTERPRTEPAIVENGPGRRRPLYRSVGEALRQRLSGGQITAGARMPPLRELARQFNVSTVTVRQALRSLEQEGHLHCIPGVGVFARPAIPARRATDQITVAFVTIEIENAFTSQIAHGIEEACQERGWQMQLVNARGDPETEGRNLSRLSRSGVDGAIVLPVSEAENLEAMVQLKLARFPFVLVDRRVPGLKVDVVATDHEKGAYLATEHLIQQGHRRVLLVSQSLPLSPVTARNRGYEQALLDHGIDPRREWKLWISEESVAHGARSGRRWLGGYEAAVAGLRNVSPPVAIFAHNAYSGWGVFEACRELGLRIPHDVSVVCFDDAEFTRALSPAMTAMAQRTHVIARTAVELLERRVAHGGTPDPQQVLVDADLVERGSVVPPGEESA